MNLSQLHQGATEVSAKAAFKSEAASATSIHIQQGGILKEHVSKIPALLVCISGKALYEDGEGNTIELSKADYVAIKSHVKHQVSGIEDSMLLLIR